MAEERTQRRLAAILAADVVGYSRLMEQNESDTLAALKVRRKTVLEPLAAKYGGRIFKITGDGVLVEFPSAVNAVQCAIALQQGMEAANGDTPDGRRIVLRIGMNLGDIMVEGGDLYGDGVNIAARLESLAQPGSICVSAKLRDEIGHKLDLDFDDLGEHVLKNLASPVRVYSVRSDKEASGAQPSPALPDRPSIAVLPFENMSGDPEQEYFADGVVEEIITALSRFRGLFVIARNSSFTYKGRALDVKQIGRELGVRYVLEGSVRRAGNRVRITGQLIDTSNGAHLWAERFDGELEDVFNLQDEVAASVVGTAALKLEQAEIERVKSKPTASMDAYDYYLRGLACVHQWTKAASSEALLHFYRAIELDPNFACAYGMAARCYTQRKAGGWIADSANELAEAERLAWRAAELGKDDAIALCTAGMTLVHVSADYVADGDALIDQALVLNPNLAWAWLWSGWVKVALGEPEAAIERVGHAMRLSPQDPQSFSMQTAIACAHLVAGRYEDALSAAGIAMRAHPDFCLSNCAGATSAALAGRINEARKIVFRLRQIDPGLRISNLKDLLSFLRPDDYVKWVEGLRKAGLPE